MIKVTDLHKAFSPTIRPLRGITLEIPDKKNTVVIGRSGSGKSVLLKSIVGLVDPERGSIVVDDVEVIGASGDDLRDIRYNVGYVFQGGALYDSLTVGENLAFPLEKTRKMSRGEISDRVAYYLEQVGLPDKVRAMPADLSGGQRKRVGVARTIVTEPKYLLYDEPTTGLDPLSTTEISELILKLRDELKITGLAVTHDPLCMKIIGDSLAYISDGKISYHGTPEEARSMDDEFLSSFFSYENASTAA